jgi:hypothetical protein
MRGLGTEVLAQFLRIAEFLVFERQRCTDVPKRAAQLIVMRITTGQAVIVDEYLQLAPAERGCIKVG